MSTDVSGRLGSRELPSSSSSLPIRLPVALMRNSFNWTLTRPTTLKIHETNFYREHARFERGALVDSTALKGKKRKRERERETETKNNLAGTGTKNGVNPVHRLPPK